MSAAVGLPVSVLTFGVVSVPQADVVEANVHLGCSKEVSSFDVLLQNWNGKYSPSGVSPILVGADGGMGLCRAPSNPASSAIISLRVESVKYESDPLESYVRVSGRCWGEKLFRRVVTVTFEDAKGEDIVKDLMDDYAGLSHVRGGVELVEDTDTTYTKLVYEDAPLWDILKYVAETSDKAGVIGYDFRVAPDGKFEFFPKNSKTNAVILDIEYSEYRKDIARVRNRIKIYGEASKSVPLDKDGLTEILAPPYGVWAALAGAGVVAQDSTVKTRGTSSVKCHADNLVSGAIKFTFAEGYEVNCNLYPELYFFMNVAKTYGPFGTVWLTDIDGNTMIKNYAVSADGEWHSGKLGVGEANVGDWETVFEGFDWTQVKIIGFRRWYPNGSDGFPAVGWGDFWVDGLYFGGCRYSAVREDVAVSQAAYGLREYVETDEELWSDNECDLRAKALLAYLKDLAEYLTIKSTVIDFGVSPILAGDKIHVELPNEGVDGDFRVESIEYSVDAESQTLELTAELGKEPPQIADYLYGLRAFTVNVEKLARTKRGGKGGSGGGGGGSSGGGGGYNGIGLLEVRCAAPSFTWAVLEPYLWGFSGGAWTPDGLELPLGSSILRFKDETTLNYLDMGMIFNSTDASPILWLSEHLVVKKDFACGGMLTSLQGALFLGSGLQAETDMPQIVLAHSEVAYGNMDTLEIWRFGKPGLAKLKCDTLLVGSIKKVDGSPFDYFLIPDEYGYVTISGIHFGSGWGDIYRSTYGSDNVIVLSGYGLVLDGYMNAKSISLNPPSGIPAVASDSSAVVCTNLNADRLDDHHASDFAVLDAYGYTSVSGVHFGEGWGDIYRSAMSGDNVIVVSGYGLVLDGYLNAKSISLNPPGGVPALSSTSSVLVCTGINADMLDGYHASSFLGSTANVAVAKVGGGTRTLQFTLGRYTGYVDS